MTVISPSRLLQLMVAGMLGGVLLVTLGIAGFQSYQAHQQLREQRQQAQQQELDEYRLRLEYEVDALQQYLSYQLGQAENLLRQMSEEQVDAAHAVATGIYETARGYLPQQQIKQLIISSLRDLRFFQGRGYIFIDGMDGECILLPTSPHLEGTSLWDNQDDTGHYIMRGLVEAVSSPQGRGFSRYRWYRPDQPDQMAEKIAYARQFEPFNWLIGSGDYIYQMEANLQEMVLQRIENLHLPAEGYIAVLDEQGRLLTSNASPKDLGKLPQDMEDLHQQELVQKLLEKAQQGGGFIEYFWERPGHEGRYRKLSRVAWVPETRWIIVAGGYPDLLKDSSLTSSSWLQRFWQEFPRLIAPLLIIGLITLLAVLVYARWLGRLLAHYQSNISEQQTRLQQLAERDTLTDLPNRWLLGKRLLKAMDRAAAEQQQLALLVLDIDRFKNINDSLGHSLGDKILQQLAKRLKKVLPPELTVARMGGDEFVLLVERFESQQQLTTLAQQLLDLINQPIQVEYHQLVMTASVGIALYPDHGINQEVLFRHADTAMYQAKNRGRNRFCFYSREMGEQVVGRLQLENDLRLAIQKEQQLFLVYQPQWDILSGRMVGCEVLVRWKHPLKGLIPPDVFIPLAEETGLILPLGNWILRTALAQARSWKDQQLPDFTLAINLSTAQLNAGLPRQIAAMLRSYELAPGRLELEVTETLLMTAPEESTRVLGELKKTGIRIALDDFGTGYSSLAYLSRLPLDVLKIDKSFVDGLPDRQDDVVIARLIIRMAAQLGMITLAEGVENEAQLRFLKEAGCHLMQGYLKARPLPPEEVAALVSPLSAS